MLTAVYLVSRRRTLSILTLSDERAAGSFSGAAVLMLRDRYLVSMIARTQRQMSIVRMIAYLQRELLFPT